MSRPSSLLPRVTQVQVLENFELLLQFKDGSLKQFDVKPYLNLPAFKRLTSGGLFYKARVERGTVVWDEQLDLAPETLYLKSQKIGQA